MPYVTEREGEIWRVILRTVSEIYTLHWREILDGGRPQRVVEARQLGMTLTREFTGLPYAQVSALWGKTHANVMWGEKRIAALSEVDSKVSDRVKRARKMVKRWIKTEEASV